MKYFGKAKRAIEMFIFGEMGDVAQKSHGYGIIVRVKAGDHTPPHAHVLDTNNKSKGKFVITEEAPEVIDEVVSMRGYEIPEQYKSKIVEWAKGNRRGINNWLRLLDEWDNQHPNND